ncbi:putative uncharacterized protein [Collinsella sp. CAG:398]|nr:putative uncharacterized protein [Collinsella sp. CAG:398]
MPRGTKWSYEETRMAFALYFLIGASKADKRNSDVKRLAQALGRTPDAVAMKLCNIAANDKNHVSTGKVGLRNSAKLDRDIWLDYERDRDAFLDNAIRELENTVQHKDSGYESLASVTQELEYIPEGREQRTFVRVRINQQYFRHTLMETYEGHCCLTGLGVPELLIASHIKPWSACDPNTERLAASNGLLLNALHDRAFDQGLMTIDAKLRVRISSHVKHSEQSNRFLWQFDGETIRPPKAHRPALEFIEYHNDVVFKG